MKPAPVTTAWPMFKKPLLWLAIAAALSGTKAGVSFSDAPPRDLVLEHLSWQHTAADTITMLGRELARFPTARDTFLLEGGALLEPATDGETFYLADRMAGRVYHLDLDARLLRSFGRRGQGPGELEYIISMQAVEGGVWVLDMPSQKVVRFFDSGQAPEERSLRRGAVTHFAAFGERLIVPDPNSFLGLIEEDGNYRDVGLSPSVTVPDALRATPGHLRSNFGWLLSSLSGYRMLLVLNQPDNYRAWTIGFAPDLTEVREISEVPVPDGVSADFMSGFRDVGLDELEGDTTGLRMIPSIRASSVHGVVWVTAPSPKYLGFLLPMNPDDRFQWFVRPTEAGRGIEDDFATPVDYLVFGDRVVVLWDLVLIIVERRDSTWGA